MQCANQLKQISLALQNYHDTHNAFPAGVSKKGKPQDASGTGDNTARWSYLFTVAPFLEQQSAYDFIQTTTDVVNGGHITPTYVFPIWQQKISMLMCPSDGNGKAAEFAANNYGEILADRLLADAGSPANNNTPTDRTRANRTVFAKLLWRDMSFVSDGTSNTLAVSEFTQDVAGSYKVKGGILPVSSGSMATNPSLCNPATLLDPANRNSYRGPTFVNTSKNTGRTGADRNTSGNIRGSIWTEGGFPYIGINTILPPNSTSCARQSDMEGSYALNSASSYHSGGVNASLFDGSVRFVSDTINSGTDTASNEPGDLAGGISPYGLWGSVGTPNDGGSVSLP
jgi:prepilin-type processing-associated H-X9-DG protein